MMNLKSSDIKIDRYTNGNHREDFYRMTHIPSGAGVSWRHGESDAKTQYKEKKHFLKALEKRVEESVKMNSFKK